ncbi:MAG: hypothetical protein ACLFNU_01130 [Bacteroidales bacterium]
MITKIKQQLKPIASSRLFLSLSLIISMALLMLSCETDDILGLEENMQTLSGSYDDELILKNIFDDPAKVDYTVSGDMVVNDKLIIEAGVRIEFEEDLELQISADGVIIAEGTESDMITFTTANSEAGKYWKGLRIKSSDQRNMLEHVKIEFAGNSNMNLGPYSSQNRQTNVGVDDDAALTILNSHISDSKGYGLFVRGTLVEHHNNTYSSNASGTLSTHIQNAGEIDQESVYSGNGYDGPEIYGGVLQQEIQWSKLSQDAAYKIISDIEIEAALYITEGVNLEFDEDVLIEIKEGSGGSINDGYIDVSGTESNPVVFTTLNLAGGQHWKGIYVKTTDARNKMNNVIVEYAGNSNISIGPYSSQNRSTNIGIDSQASLEVANAVIRNSKGWGLAAMESSSIQLESITYESNTEGDLTIVD